jgi:SRSO17 transposase
MLSFPRISAREAAVEPSAVLTAPVLDLTPQDLDTVLDELTAFHAIFSPLFARQEQREWSRQYLHGLLLELPRKSIEPMVLALRGADRNAVRAMQQFLSEGAWDDRAILHRLWSELAADLGDVTDGVLMLDGSDVPKQGTDSVGVKRQYCGQLGKTANCQAGVFVAYASERGYALLDRRLYLPEDWFSAEYAERRLACGVPADVTFTTKPMLGLEMIQAVLTAGSLPFQWVAGDEAFGDNPALLDAIADLGKWYYMEVAHDTRVWRERPATAPLPWSGRGRKPSNARLVEDAAAPVGVAELAAALPATAWQRATIQEGSQGPQQAEFAFHRVVAVRNGLPGPDVWLILRRSLTDGELKTYLSNAPADIATRRLVRTSGMRWPIESCFLVGKQELGMGDYEVRSWRGWHHHMTLVLVALAFLVRLQGRFKQTLLA